MRVNHAGEHGAICIYTGQIHLARITSPAMVEELRTFRSHEQRHRALFAAELHRRGRPRCPSYWLCGLAGYVLGAITGVLGPQAIAATTVAVESVVLRHLKHQMAVLEGRDPAAVQAIAAIVEEEQQHHDQSAGHVRHSRFWSAWLTPIVAGSTESVIWLGMRL